MPPFPEPSFKYTYDLATEIAAARAYRDTEPGRGVPAKSQSRLLVASWNLANFGLQKRTPDDYQLMAEFISWFDVIAVQEVNDNLAALRSLRAFLPDTYRLLFSDAAGKA
jgi:hypothetical protein